MIRAGGSNSTPGLGGDRAAVPDGNPVRSGGGGGGGEQRGEHAPAAAELGWPDSMATAAREGERSIDRGEGSDDGEGSSAGVVVGEERMMRRRRERERERRFLCVAQVPRPPHQSPPRLARGGRTGERRGEGDRVGDPDPDPGGRSSHARRRMTVINLARARVLCGRVVVASLHRGIVATREMLIGEKKSRRRGRVRLSRKLISVRVFGLVQSSLDLTCVLETWSINIASTVCS